MYYVNKKIIKTVFVKKKKDCTWHVNVHIPWTHGSVYSNMGITCVTTALIMEITFNYQWSRIIFQDELNFFSENTRLFIWG